MRKAVIVALICVNAVLLAALLAHAARPQPASAQAYRGAADYLVATGKLSESVGNLWVLDLAGRKLGAWRFNKTTGRMDSFTQRDLVRDFGRDKQTLR